MTKQSCSFFDPYAPIDPDKEAARAIDFLDGVMSGRMSEQQIECHLINNRIRADIFREAALRK